MWTVRNLRQFIGIMLRVGNIGVGGNFLLVLIVLDSKKCYTTNINEGNDYSIMRVGGVTDDSFKTKCNERVGEVAGR